MDVTPKPAAPADEGRTHLTGVISRILTYPDGAWAEITVEGAPDLFREIRVPYPLQNQNGTVSRLHEGDRVSIFVTPT